MKRKTILITGGHLTPAIATIEEIKKRSLQWDVIFIGRAKAKEHSSESSNEHDEMSELDIPFYPITTGRLQRFLSLHSFISFCKIPIGLLQAMYYCLRFSPVCIVSFGGYVALPVVLAGWVFGIPTITHEQTSVIGLANRIIGRFAKKICVSFPSTLHDAPKNKSIYTGLPIRKNIIDLSKRNSTIRKTARPVLYITGGTTGAASINSVIFSILSELTKRYRVIHQTGKFSYEAAVSHASTLTADEKLHYTPVAYVTSDEISTVLNKASLVIGRSGANTTIELATIGIPGLFIPLPWSGGGEQQKNAKWLADRGVAVIIPQDNLTPSLLINTIDGMISHISEFRRRAISFRKTMPLDGASRFVNEIESIV